MNLYAYVGNDPVNFTDPFGLCKVEGDTLTECDIDMSDETLTDDQLEAANQFVARLVEIGKAIYASDDQDLVDAFESIDVVRFSGAETSPKGGAATSKRSLAPNAVEQGLGADILTFYGMALSTGGTGNIATQLTGHEVEHFTQRNRALSKMNAGNSFMLRRMEVRTDHRSIQWMQKTGLLPSPYKSQSVYTRGMTFPLDILGNQR